ncbi:pilus assembly protein PilM [Candidatus Calescamantes bacterium]|nr:pilus assembly protein PilM [Candidatus Calescamantes bacterium]
MARYKDVLLIDLGNSGIKIIEVRGKQIINYAYREVDPSLEGEEKKIAFRQAIRGILENHRFRTKLALLVISSPRIYIRSLVYPPIPKEDLWIVMERDAQVHLPPTQGKVLLDFFLQEEKEGERRYKVVFCDEAEVDDRVGLLEEVGWRVFQVVPSPYSAINALPEEKKRGVRAVLDIGAKGSILSIAKEGKFEMLLTIPVGGNNFTGVISNALNVSFLQAEELKKKENFLSPSSRVAETLRNLILQLAEEVKLGFQLFSRESRGEGVEELILTGGGSKLRDLKKVMEEHLGIKISEVDLLQEFDLSLLSLERKEYLKGLAPLFWSVLGAWEYEKLPNLVRRKHEKKRREERKRAALLTYFMGLIMVSVLAISPQLIRGYRWRSEIDSNAKIIEKLLPLMEEVNKMEKEKKIIEEKINFIREFYERGEAPWKEFFRTLSLTIPPDVWINRIEYSGGNKVSIRGSALSGEEMSKWIQEWKKSPAVEEISILAVEGTEGGRRDFQLEVKIKR